MVGYTCAEQSFMTPRTAQPPALCCSSPSSAPVSSSFPHCTSSSLVKDWREPLCRSLDISLQFLPFWHSLCKLRSCKLASWNSALCPQLSETVGFAWVLCSALCLEGSLQAAMWATVRLISFVSLPSRIAALLCLLSSIWKELFYVFAWVSSYLW